MTPKFRLVFFDVDSTLVTIEGIDVLATGHAEVAGLTAAAMNGEIPLDQVYARRLDIIRPTRTAIDALGDQYCRSLVEGAEETISMLQGAGVQIHLVSAGIAQAIEPLGRMLNIPPRAIHAVSLKFDGDRYVDFDRRSFLTRPGGKELVVRQIRARSHGKAAFVGDGVSDLETKPAVDLFIGFGGVAIRPPVRDQADVYVSEPRLSAVLTHLME